MPTVRLQMREFPIQRRRISRCWLQLLRDIRIPGECQNVADECLGSVYALVLWADQQRNFRQIFPSSLAHTKLRSEVVS